MKILLAEDDANIATIARLALETIGGHNVEVASDGEAALKRMMTEEFDVILLDEMMPKMNGLKVCEEYSKSGRTAPVIFMSANVQDNQVQQFKTAAIGFIPKPFDPMALAKQVESILQKRAA
jgi:two-component system, OmpR family, response regulator